MKHTFLAAIAAFAVSPNFAFALTETFDTSTSFHANGITLGGAQMVWNGTGGGHVYNEYHSSTASFYFDVPTTVNSIDMNGMPWENYVGGSGLDDHTLTAYDASGNILWQTSLDLTAYTTWDNWLTVDINVEGVAQIDSHGYGHWASFDNLVMNEALPSVPLPAGLPLLAGGMGALAMLKRRRKAR